MTILNISVKSMFLENNYGALSMKHNLLKISVLALSAGFLMGNSIQAMEDEIREIDGDLQGLHCSAPQSTPSENEEEPNSSAAREENPDSFSLETILETPAGSQSVQGQNEDLERDAVGTDSPVSPRENPLEVAQAATPITVLNLQDLDVGAVHQIPENIITHLNLNGFLDVLVPYSKKTIVLEKTKIRFFLPNNNFVEYGTDGILGHTLQNPINPEIPRASFIQGTKEASSGYPYFHLGEIDFNNVKDSENGEIKGILHCVFLDGTDSYHYLEGALFSKIKPKNSVFDIAPLAAEINGHTLNVEIMHNPFLDKLFAIGKIPPQ